MKRPKQHETDKKAQKILDYKLSDSLLLRKQEDDYGIDGELEWFNNRETTGVIFKLQLKGTEKANFIENDSKISFSYRIDRGAYLIEQIEIPSIIVLVDVINEIVYWVSVLNNSQLTTSYELAKFNNQDTFTIHFDPSNTIPETESKLLREIAESGYFTGAKKFARIDTDMYAKYLKGFTNLEDEHKHLNQKIEITYSLKLSDLLDTGQLGEANNLISTILDSNERSTLLKFDVVVKAEDLFYKEKGNSLQLTDRLNFEFWQSQTLDELSRNSDMNDGLNIVADGYRALTAINAIVSHDFQLYMNWRMHSKKSSASELGDMVFWLPDLYSERVRISNNLHDKIDEFLEYLPSILKTKYYSFFVTFSLRLIASLSVFACRILQEGLSDSYTQIENTIDYLIEVSYQLANDKQKDNIAQKHTSTFQLFMSSVPKDSENLQYFYDKGLKLASKISNGESRKYYQHSLNQAYEQILNPEENSSKVDWESVEQFYKQQAISLGIDLSLADKDFPQDHPQYDDSRIAWIINVGIQDLNPERIFKNCKHIALRLTGGLGIPAQMLKLHTACMKTMSCSKHPEHGGISTYSLDHIYSSFYEEHCKNCKDQQPQSEDWIYTPEWGVIQENNYKQAVEKYKQEKSELDG